MDKWEISFLKELKEKKGFEKPMFVFIKVAKLWLIIGLLFTAFAWSYFKVPAFKSSVKSFVPQPVIEFLLKDVANAKQKIK